MEAQSSRVCLSCCRFKTDGEKLKLLKYKTHTRILTLKCRFCFLLTCPKVSNLNSKLIRILRRQHDRCRSSFLPTSLPVLEVIKSDFGLSSQQSSFRNTQRFSQRHRSPSAAGDGAFVCLSLPGPFQPPSLDLPHGQQSSISKSGLYQHFQGPGILTILTCCSADLYFLGGRSSVCRRRRDGCKLEGWKLGRSSTCLSSKSGLNFINSLISTRPP